MFILYCDDSGTHAGSEVAVAACLIATEEQWTHFNRNWNAAEEREHFGAFHMASFVAKQDQFASPEWNNAVKRERTVRALINLINTRVSFGFSASVLKSAFDAIVVDGGLKHRFGENHYAFAVRICTAMLNRWREKHHYAEPVQYVFDQMTKGKGDINSLFETLVKGKDDAMRRYGVSKDCWSFRDKAGVLPLQATDIWAWENYKYMVDTFLPGKVKGRVPRPPRRSYLALIDHPTEVKYHNEETLKDLVSRMPDWAFA